MNNEIIRQGQYYIPCRQLCHTISCRCKTGDFLCQSYLLPFFSRGTPGNKFKVIKLVYIIMLTYKSAFNEKLKCVSLFDKEHVTLLSQCT